MSVSRDGPLVEMTDQDLPIRQPVVNDELSGLRYDELTLRGMKCLVLPPNC
jgi:hypothetical protein